MKRESLRRLFLRVRELSEALCRPLAVEDYGIQSMPDASPPKWHLAHTTWFFESFLLNRYRPGYTFFNPDYPKIFNSYYQSLGTPYFRPHRGLLSRPLVSEIYNYRETINARMLLLIREISDDQFDEAASLIVLGLHHEQQHQELLITDIKHAVYCSPLHPGFADIFSNIQPKALPDDNPLSFVSFRGGLTTIGFAGSSFAYDNETPAHTVSLRDFLLADRLVSNGDYLAFMEDGGYENPLLWLSDGWDAVRQFQWRHPLYWKKEDGAWMEMTLSGYRPLELRAPVSHVSYFEADAYARWAGARLPTEFEWENGARTLKMNPDKGNLLGSYETLSASYAEEGNAVYQLAGDVWEWTGSAYLPYPGFVREVGALGEYNAKFMYGQMVLRGGSCATPRHHLRVTYRNFFPGDKRWQFTGIRLAKDSL